MSKVWSCSPDWPPVQCEKETVLCTAVSLHGRTEPAIHQPRWDRGSDGLENPSVPISPLTRCVPIIVSGPRLSGAPFSTLAPGPYRSPSLRGAVVPYASTKGVSTGASPSGHMLSGDRTLLPSTGKGLCLDPCLLEAEEMWGFHTHAPGSRVFPTPFTQGQHQGLRGGLQRQPWSWARFHLHRPWHTCPSALLLAVRIGEGTWLRMRLRASGRVSTRDRWRRVEQRRASHSPRGFPELWRALRAHVAGPSLCRGAPLLCRLRGLPAWPGRTPSQQPAQPHESDTATLQTLAHPPQGHGSGLPVCVLLGDTLHPRKMHLTPRVYGH